MEISKNKVAQITLINGLFVWNNCVDYWIVPYFSICLTEDEETSI